MQFGAQPEPPSPQVCRPVPTTRRALAARKFAVAAHGRQLYGDRPYIEHLIAVVEVLEEFGFSDGFITAGWLHDVVEDTAAGEADIKSAFGERVAKLVSAVSGGGDRASHVASIYEKIVAFPAAAVVKLADRIATRKHAGLGTNIPSGIVGSIPVLPK